MEKQLPRAIIENIQRLTRTAALWGRKIAPITTLMIALVGFYVDGIVLAVFGGGYWLACWGWIIALDKAINRPTTDNRADVIGPHVIQPTGERRQLNDTSNEWRTLDRWACKYCGWEGFHPDEVEVNIGIRQDCDDMEWIGSEKIAFDAE